MKNVKIPGKQQKQRKSTWSDMWTVQQQLQFLSQTHEHKCFLFKIKHIKLLLKVYDTLHIFTLED